MCLHYTHKIATKFQVPRISFHGFCCFSLLCDHNLKSSNILETITSDSEYFRVPGLTEKVEFTKAQLPLIRDESWKAILEPLTEADKASYGVIINTFEELESAYVREYKKIRKSWCIEPNSVIYACLGSISTIKFPELTELGLGLEASNKPFIWVLRGKNATSNQVEKWIKEDGFEERTKGRGLIIVGWAPQVLILSHSAIGGFLTHCGWNSTIEGISAGVPLITLPLLGDQFFNQKLVVQILKIGVNLGIEKPTMFGDEESGFILKKVEVKNAIYQLIDEGNEGIERRKRAKVFGEKAKKAIEVGGSSYLNITLLIEDIIQQSSNMCLDLTSVSHDGETGIEEI
ncbi:hypothetical protein Golob_011989 [Gossypium lobatum]|uniref:UDP-glycosyltransferases domain-containing protein n=1 Tax=Gossypium lobatum TaxID=34289 RepID=A0A7J8MR97_9ROSI|nr:hypothetical protein [Gossypium lobatum]